MMHIALESGSPFLIGRIKRIYALGEVAILKKFPFLIGRIKRKENRNTTGISDDEFPFLIGRIKRSNIWCSQKVG
ncbi:hypothetical protein AA81_11730 [Petrotoga halophila DSM 16923]|uniref:Uncharacterized protein n=1 Tax=Petrotoga halophila DSM 16923 TaxID=1122953 RepID=A0A2S5EAS4_9BACT|nr:hypothetical protein AA81_11730 [Petrotoga halophila DSM 16923]